LKLGDPDAIARTRDRERGQGCAGYMKDGDDRKLFGFGRGRNDGRELVRAVVAVVLGVPMEFARLRAAAAAFAGALACLHAALLVLADFERGVGERGGDGREQEDGERLRENLRQNL